MTDLPMLLLLAVTLTFLAAGFVKGAIGMGLPTVAMGLLSAVMPPVAAAALLVVPSFVTNVWQLAAGPSFAALARRLWPMLLGIVIGTVAGAGLLTGASAGRATVALGVTLALYALVGLTPLRLAVRRSAEPWLSPLIGLATGLVTGATGVFVLPAVPYLQALDLEKDDLVQALGLSFTVSTVALALGLARGGAFEPTVAWGSLLALAPALAGMAAGQWLRRRIPPAAFRLCFFIGLLGLGLHLALRPLI